MPLPPAGATPARPLPPKEVRPLDGTDRAILRALADDARISNKELAERVRVAQSTCLARVRALRDDRVIRGYHADIDPIALGHDLQAMIAIRLQPHARGAMGEFVAALSGRPEVLEIYFVAGANDFLVHVATSSTDELRRFVGDHLNRDPAIAGTETNLIFEHTPASRGLSARESLPSGDRVEPGDRIGAQVHPRPTPADLEGQQRLDDPPERPVETRRGSRPSGP